MPMIMGSMWGETLSQFIRLFWRELSVFILATLPGVEMRIALPTGVAAGMHPLEALIITYAGSMLPAWPILLWIKPFFNALRKRRLFLRQIDHIIERALKRTSRVQVYSLLGLMFFVSIPLPLTGVWTGALTASLLDLPSGKAFVALAAGNGLAGIVLAFFSAQVF